MRVLIAPDSFGGTMSAAEVAQAIRTGWQRSAVETDIVSAPLSDGGPGFLEVIRSGHEPEEIETLVVTVAGPRGESVPATILVHEQTAYVESAQASGLHLVRQDERDPMRASSAGLGMLLGHAREVNVERIVVGLGGTATVDAGAGMLGALGARANDERGLSVDHLLLGGPEGLRDVAWVDLAPALGELADIDLVAAVDVEVPLTGSMGAVRGFAPQKFADPASVSAAQLDDLEAIITRFTEHAHGTLGTDSLTERPGAGAAGGIGWALQALGATVVPGFDVVAAAVGLDHLLEGVDLVVTGEGRLDWQTRRGKVIAGIAEHASARGIPVVAIAGRVDLGARELASLGIVEAWALAEQPGGLARSMISPHATVADVATRIARLWASGRP